MDLALKAASEIEYCDDIGVIIDTFDFALYGCLDRLVFTDLIYEKWISLVTILFILSFTLLFIVTSISTIIALLVFLLSSLVLPMLILLNIHYLFLLYY